MMLTKLELPRRQMHCSGAPHSFLQGDKCYTLISLEVGGWKRQDFCESCWAELKSRGLPASTKSYWHAAIPIKKVEEALPERKEEKALSLIRKALVADTPNDRRESFILALYLVRKKMLAFRQKVELQGEVIHLYEVVATEELLAVKTIALHPADIDILQGRLAEMLAE